MAERERVQRSPFDPYSATARVSESAAPPQASGKDNIFVVATSQIHDPADHKNDGLAYDSGRGVNTNDERIATLERRVKELEMCCERLKAYVDDLDKRKADRTAGSPPVYFQPGEVPRFEGSRDELTRQQRR